MLAWVFAFFAVFFAPGIVDSGRFLFLQMRINQKTEEKGKTK